jgi:FlaA1/EpsC-like NDP-sugar epimerase
MEGMRDRAMPLAGKRVLITGGTGSLGKTLLRRLLDGEAGEPARIVVLSRDEAKQYFLQLEYRSHGRASEDILYSRAKGLLDFRIGDVRDPETVAAALRGVDVVFNAAALKQVPTCEYFPVEAVLTNVMGPANIVQAIRAHDLPVEAVVGISTDKAVKPVNVMGMTKAIQERVFARANLETGTRFVMVRYGNVLASRGSAIPLFQDQIRKGGPVTITDERMTRFLMSLDHAVDIILAALVGAKPGQTFVPRAPAARMVDVANALIGSRPIETKIIGVRPGEKIHEVLVSEDEARRTWRQGDHLVIDSILPELATEPEGPVLMQEYSSGDEVIPAEAVARLLAQHRLLHEAAEAPANEVLR